MIPATPADAAEKKAREILQNHCLYTIGDKAGLFNTNELRTNIAAAIREASDVEKVLPETRFAQGPESANDFEWRQGFNHCINLIRERMAGK